MGLAQWWASPRTDVVDIGEKAAELQMFLAEDLGVPPPPDLDELSH